jgi:hypothetical protein
MYYIIYLSAAVNLPDENELMSILSVSRRNNALKGLTGILLYGNGQFIQLLEGEKVNVQQTFEKIGDDKRHKGITLVASGEIKSKIFPDWSMGFKTMKPAFFTDMECYINLTDKNNFSNNEQQLPIKLLKAFMKTAV